MHNSLIMKPHTIRQAKSISGLAARWLALIAGLLALHPCAVAEQRRGWTIILKSRE